jgi:hypothetical protein
LALTRGPVALLGDLATDAHTTIRAGAIALTWATAAFCFVRGLPVLVEGCRHMAGSVASPSTAKIPVRDAV